MGLFQRRRRPEWAGFFPASEWPRFSKILASGVAKGLVGARIAEDEGVILLPDNSRAGLLNLAQTCSQLSDAEWAAEISRFMRTIADKDSFQELPRDEILQRLKVRIYPEGGYEAVKGPRWPIADGVFACLAIDLPDTIRTLSPEEWETLGLDAEAAFRLGLDHVAAQDPPEHQNLAAEELPIEVLEGESLFTATHLLMLERYMDPVPEFGALVCLPTRHGVLFSQIRDLRVIESIQTLARIATMLYEQGPGQITPDLFWWDQGRLVRIPFDFVADNFNVYPPDEFVERVLNKLTD